MTPPKPTLPHSVEVLVALGLVAVSLLAVGGVAYTAVVRDTPSAITTLGLIATASLGALTALAGVRHGQNTTQNKD